MRRLSVTEYLIAQNQAQTTVTTYAKFGDAINAVETLSGESYDSICELYEIDVTNRAQEIIRETILANVSCESRTLQRIYALGNWDTDAFIAVWFDSEREQSAFTVHSFASFNI